MWERGTINLLQHHTCLLPPTVLTLATVTFIRINEQRLEYKTTGSLRLWKLKQHGLEFTENWRTAKCYKSRDSREGCSDRSTAVTAFDAHSFSPSDSYNSRARVISFKRGQKHLKIVWPTWTSLLLNQTLFDLCGQRAGSAKLWWCLKDLSCAGLLAPSIADFAGSHAGPPLAPLTHLAVH